MNTIFSEVSLAWDLKDQKDATDLLVDITDISFSTDIAHPPSFSLWQVILLGVFRIR